MRQFLRFFCFGLEQVGGLKYQVQCPAVPYPYLLMRAEAADDNTAAMVCSNFYFVPTARSFSMVAGSAVIHWVI